MKAPSGWSALVTCEHGGNEVPAAYRALFEGRSAELTSHRGWDAGTLALARTLAERLAAPLVSAETTRLLVDLNRSPRNPRVFSSITRTLPRTERLALLERYHAPHWQAARAAVARGITEKRRVMHLAVHSFTPVLDGTTRRADIALLYDPARPRERAFAASWARALEVAEPTCVVRRNDPYRGSADGLTTALRREYPAARYLGIEVEINQRHVGEGGRFPAWVAEALAGSLERVLAV
jgi:predicted N-formylglutamate amidohydrolase